MVMHWPRLAWLCLALIGFGVDLAKNGQPKTGKHSAAASAIAFCVVYWILDQGGFFAGVTP